MAKLSEIQNEVVRQLTRDYGGSVQDEQIRSLCLLGLGEETGEVLGLEKRRVRQNSRDSGKFTRERYVEELGDVLWYFIGVCSNMGITLDEVWEANQEKLEERYGV